MSVFQATPVQVNLNVEIDADSELNIFGSPAVTVNNVVVPEVLLPVNALYKSGPPGSLEEMSVVDVALIEFWEPSDKQGDIRCKLASTNSFVAGEGYGENLSAGGGLYKKAAKRLAKGLQKILVDKMDASAASPFNDGRYMDNSAYYLQRDFGRLALGTLAHNIFGHVDATAAITNDKTFVEKMLSLEDAGDDETASGPANRYAEWNKKTIVDGSDVLVWSDAGDKEDANLAVRLVKAIINKGISSGTLVESNVNDAAANPGSLANIVKQVIGQDASRTMAADGSQRTLDKHLSLPFFEGDVIYVNIKVKTPSIVVANGQNVATQENLQALYPTASEESYTLKITLGPEDASLDA
jgi:hypothetical protein